MNDKIIFANKEKLFEARDLLEEYKSVSPVLGLKYDKFIKDNNKIIKGNLIAKIHHIASWGDLKNMLYETVKSSKTSKKFIDKLKIISSNIYGANLVNGPVQGKLLSKNLHKNTWYNILKKAIALSIRANQHAINFIERNNKNIISSSEIQSKITKINNKVNANKKITIDHNIPDSWDD